METINQQSVFKHIVQTTGDLPTLPPIANLVLEKMSDPDVTAKQLHDIISKDQSLAARILKIANSTFYGCSRNITRVSDAVVIIGFKTIKSLLLTSVLKDLLKNFGLIEKLLWDHSLGCAFGSKILAQYIKFTKIEEAFLSGLMHDIGKVVLNIKLPDKMPGIIKDIYNSSEKTFVLLEQEVLGFNHAQVGQLVAQKWNFAEEIDEAIGTHHNPQLATLLPTLSYIVNLANAFCHKLEIGPTRRPHLDLMTLDSVKFLRLDETTV
ncbi:MAG: HDOD domain-containing protein, partial [Desulforhabdus sp.]|nr:HDOD domain-containing protein [Desulforhabdus sp.]